MYFGTQGAVSAGMSEPNTTTPLGPSRTVFIVDDDAAVRSAVSMLVQSCGWQARPFPSAEAFLDAYRREPGGCLVLDLQMPGMSGVDLQTVLGKLGMHLPVIIITAYGDHAMVEKARAAGARAVLTKPFRDGELLRNIELALAEDG